MIRSRLSARGVAIAAVVIAMAAGEAERAHAQAPVFRTRLGISAGLAIPLNPAGHHRDLGTSGEFQIGVGDDPQVFCLAVSYSSIGGAPFTKGLEEITTFELRLDLTPEHQKGVSPAFQLGCGLFKVADPVDPTENRRFGLHAGLGYRWLPDWHTGLGLMVGYNNAMDLGRGPLQWATVSVEWLKWTE